MSERKRWDKHQDFQPSRMDATSDAKADPVLTKQLQYIKVLEERNRVKKRLAAASKRNDRLQEREEAFVTAFNVPARGAQSTSSSILSSRNTRSATSVLPTKLPGKREEAKLSKCRSAPSTTLNFAAGNGQEKSADKNRVRRAKWNRPQAPMGIAVDHQDGVPLFRLTTESEEGKSGDDEEESYLEESFEEFEEDESEFDRGQMDDLVIDDIEEDLEIENEVKLNDSREMNSSTSGGVDATNELVDLSKTTKELVGMIHHLSRSKQRALVDVLQKFQASEQDANDVKVLQSSIGDPAIWKEITSALSPSPSATTSSPMEQVVPERAEIGSTAVAAYPSVAPLKSLLEEQLKWEDEYAIEVKNRLTREREEKQRMLKEAEERRAKMIRQLEDEEREIERLMEAKREERLLKLRALRNQVIAADTSDEIGGKPTIRNNFSQHKVYPDTYPDDHNTDAKSKVEDVCEEIKADDSFYVADTKEAIENSDLSSFENGSGANVQVPGIPRLNLGFESVISKADRYEIVVKLVSTWSKTRAVGLTQLCVYDLNGEELSVDTDTLRLFDQQTGRPLPQTNDMVRGLQMLFNGVAQTNSEKDMWLGRLGESGVLLVKFEVSAAPSKLCVWNYNSRKHTACARDIEVLVNDKCVWTGSLPETFGDQDDNICTWIDLQGSTRKTSRTARLEDKSLAAPKSESKAASHWTESLKSGRREATGMDEPSCEKPTESTPLWLASAQSSSTTSDKLPMTGRSSAEFEAWIADEKPSSGSLTSRRRQGKPINSIRSVAEDTKITPVQAEMKEDSSHGDAQMKEEKTCDDHNVNSPALASLSSWDSLEKFSKTNRSRLPQPTDATGATKSQMDDSYTNEAKVQPASSSMSFTTSALLTELRQGPPVTNFTSASEPVLPYPTSLDALLTKPAFTEGSTFSSSNTCAVITTDTPILPTGKWLQIEILSTWGDPYYVGLNGIEIFDHRGELVHFQDPKSQVTACPESINVLEENTDDPRVPKNLVDGVNFTCDDFHMWLAPFASGQPHYVLIEFGGSIAVSMVRIWNYNKSRTHTCRGVREARLILYDSYPATLANNLSGQDSSGYVIFEGEIRQAPGLVGADSMDLSNEVILFTQEAAILEAIEANDEALLAIAREEQREDEETREIVATVHRSMELQRPRTSDAGSRSVEKSSNSQENDDEYQPRVGKDGRPMTMANGSCLNNGVRLRTSIDSWVAEEPQQRSPDAAKVTEGNKTMGEDLNSETDAEMKLPHGRRLTLQLHSTWGDRNYIGLTQIEVLVGSRGTPIPLDVSNIDATPRDLASLGYVGDPRTLDKLIDGEATTCDDTHMWLVPKETGTVPEVRIEFKKVQYFYGLRVWNYNKSSEDTFRGVKQLSVTLDGVTISPKETGFLLRKAPGVADFDFGQVLQFSECVESPGKSLGNSTLTYPDHVRYPFNARAYKTPIIRQDYEAPLYPQGFLLKIVCWTTWGDPYYLGLNGLELYDFSGMKIVEKPAIVTAVPYSVSALDNAAGRQKDARTPENLLSGLDKNTWEAHDAWLAPLASSLGNQEGNILYIAFDTPVMLSMIKFWNYSKTPERGAKDLDIYLDDLHLFSGTLRKAPAGDAYSTNSRFTKMHKVTDQFGQSVLFSASQAQVDAEKRFVTYCGTEEQDVLGINEGQVMQESRAMYRKPDPGAEGVVVDLDCRPMTAVCRR